MRDKCTAISNKLAEAKLKYASAHTATADKISDLETSLAEAKGKTLTFDEIKQGLSTQLSEIRSNLTDKRDEITALKNDLSTTKDREHS